MGEKERWKSLMAVEREIPYEAFLKETQRLARDVSPAFAGRCQLSFRGFMAKQIKFIAWKIWFWQGMVLAFLCAVFFSIYGMPQGAVPEMLPEAVPRFLCGCSGVIAVCALPILKRSVRYRMFEVEQATRFSIRGGLTAQLLFIGIGDAGMLSVLTYLFMRFGADGKEIFLFGVIPFLTAAVSGLMLWMRREPPVPEHLTLLLCMASVCAAYVTIDAVSRTLPEAVLWIAVLYALLCTGMIGWTYRRLFSQEKEEELLWKLY